MNKLLFFAGLFNLFLSLYYFSLTKDFLKLSESKKEDYTWSLKTHFSKAIGSFIVSMICFFLAFR